MVGKPVTFTVAHSLSSNDDTPRDIGAAEMSGVDIATQLLKAGWAKLKESNEEVARAKKENARLRREMVSLRTILKGADASS